MGVTTASTRESSQAARKRACAALGWPVRRLRSVAGRQISRYENGKLTPSVEAIVKFAELFDVSVDYLLVEDATRRPFRQSHDELGTRLADLDQLSDADRAALLRILDGQLANTRIRQALHSAG